MKPLKSILAAALAVLIASPVLAAVNAQTGTSYTFVATDCGPLSGGGNVTTFSNAAAVAVVLPRAGTSGAFFPPCRLDVTNKGAGVVTITPATSTIDGQATLILAQGQGASIFSDGTNYQVVRGGAGTAVINPFVSGAVDFLTVTPGATGTPGLVKLQSTGSDTNISMLLGSKGSGTVNSGGTTLANSSLQVVTTTSAVNQVTVTGAVTTAPPVIGVGGSGADATISLALNGAGLGGVLLGGTTTTNSPFRAVPVSSGVNGVVVTGAVTGTAPSIALGGAGADANRNLSIAGSGTGIVTLGQAICTITGTSPQVCNGQRGIVTTGTLTTAAATATTFQITNSSVGTSSLVICTLQAYSGTYVTNGYPTIMECKPGSGSFVVGITNTHGANALSGTLAIGFAVLN